MKNILLIFGIILLWFTGITGCSSSKTLPAANLSSEVRSHTFNATRNVVYNAALAYLVRAGYQIDVSDSESGVISTGYKEFVDNSQVDRDDRQRLTALIAKEGQGRASVTLTLAVEYLYDDVWRTRNLDKPKVVELYEMHLQGIAQQVQQ